MLQHELLIAVAAPLIVLARPLAIWTWAFPRSYRSALARPFRCEAVRAGWRSVSAPLPAAILHAAAIWLWHVPAFFEAAESHVLLHVLQHTTFFASALVFWWAVLRPGRDKGVGVAMLCLFVTMLHTGALGALLTFSNDVWYPVSTAGSMHWGLTPIEDQQLGGLLMWIPGGTAYVIAALALAARWLTREPTSVPQSRKSEVVALRLISR
jgi:putative membrane protein